MEHSCSAGSHGLAPFVFLRSKNRAHFSGHRPPDKLQKPGTNFICSSWHRGLGGGGQGPPSLSVSLIIWLSLAALQHLLEEPFSLFIQTTLWIKQSQLNVKPNLSLDADNHFNNISPFVPKHQGNKALLLSGSVRLQLV